jgi:YidC/Oxa1 family membrane protein insertase
VLLVVSQYFTQRLTTPPNNDPSQETSRNILKFLPLMIGWFSLNVPSGLTLYWFINNVLSTAQQLYLKSSVKPPEVATATAGAGSTTTVDAQVIRPKEERVKKVSGGWPGCGGGTRLRRVRDAAVQGAASRCRDA